MKANREHSDSAARVRWN